MKKYLKYLLLCTVCLVLGEGIYLTGVSDSYSVENVIKAYDIQVDNENQCFSPSIYNDVKPVLMYIYNGEKIKDDAGNDYVCDNPEVEIMIPTIENCDFKGWYLDENLTQKVVGTKIGDVLKPKNTEVDVNGCLMGIDYITYLYASCGTPNVCDENYDRTFKINYYVDGEFFTSSIGAEGATIEILSGIGREGYTFDGWYTDSNFENKAVVLNSSKIMDNNNCVIGYRNINLYGKFTKNKDVQPPSCSEDYDKTFNVNYYVAGKLEKSVQVNIGDNIDLSNLVKEGYSFNGWYLDQALTEKVSVISTVEERDNDNCITGYKDVNLYAEFLEIDSITEPSPENPETGDNIVIFIGLGFIFLLGSSILMKKIINK